MRLKVVVPIRFEDRTIQQKVFDSLIGSVKSVVSPDVELAIESLEVGTLSIEGRADLALNQPGVMAVVVRSQAEGFDGVFVSDMDMCGVEPSRELVDIPVIGGFAANAFTASMLGRRIGLITILDRVVPMQEDHFRTYGIEKNLACILVAEASVGDLIEDPTVAVDRVFDQCCEAVDRYGAQVIILGCTGFIGIAGAVGRRLAASGRFVPVLDPNAVAISYLELLVRNGLSQSRAAYHPRSSDFAVDAPTEALR